MEKTHITSNSFKVRMVTTNGLIKIAFRLFTNPQNDTIKKQMIEFTTRSNLLHTCPHVVFLAGIHSIHLEEEDTLKKYISLFVWSSSLSIAWSEHALQFNTLDLRTYSWSGLIVVRFRHFLSFCFVNLRTSSMHTKPLLSLYSLPQPYF